MNDVVKECRIEAVMKDWTVIRDKLNASGLDFVESPAFIRDREPFKIFVWFDCSFDRLRAIVSKIGGEYIEDGKRVV